MGTSVSPCHRVLSGPGQGVGFARVPRAEELRRALHGAAIAGDGDEVGAVAQGLKLVHFSAQRKRFLWERGCISGLYRER